MKPKQIRNFIFNIHRYLGLVLGLTIVIIGLTGSLLVFHKEMDKFLITKQFGQVTPQIEKVSFMTMINSVKETYSDRPEYKISSLNISPEPNIPYKAWLESTDEKFTEVFINPYTGKILGSRPSESTFFSWVYRLHYELLAGKIGLKFVGIIALLWVILSVTGIVLWPGWRKLILGFKIKWNTHPQRVNFDVHKVTGIVVAAFLSIIAFTGFCWNFYEQTEPLIYAATFTPKLPEPTSEVIASRTALAIDKLVQKGQSILPDANLEIIYLPQAPKAALRIRKKFPQSLNNYGLSSIYLDQYTGKIIRVKNELEPSRAEAVLNSFIPLHYGTFGGFPTRIFYVFVGVAPAILLVTGIGMWWYRRKRKKSKTSLHTPENY